mgnify:FL=1|jgi:hypothetical protein
MTSTKMLLLLTMIFFVSTEAFAQRQIEEIITIGYGPGPYNPVDPNAYMHMLPSSSCYRPPAPYNNQTPQWVIDQCKVNATIAFRTCENKGIDKQLKELSRCQLVSQAMPKVALDATVGISDIGWVKWLGGEFTVSGGVTFVDPATYGIICVKRAESEREKDTNKCANKRDEKCQRKI